MIIRNYGALQQNVYLNNNNNKINDYILVQRFVIEIVCVMMMVSLNISHYRLNASNAGVNNFWISSNRLMRFAISLIKH